MKILFLSAEVAPFAKAGGLGDVAGSLPKALQALGHDVRVVMPAYQNIEAALYDGRFDLTVEPGHLTVPTGAGQLMSGVFKGQLPGSEVPIYFVAEGNMFNRPQIYGYSDDAYRFAFFSRAALELTLALEWRPDLVHGHDWHTAPAIAWLATAGQNDGRFQGIPSLFTIHNLAHQGLSPWNIVDYLGIWTHSLLEESYGQINFMARGIYHTNLINTVSPTYAREIMTPQGGAGLDGLLRHRANNVHGILNGLDTALWDPAKDEHLAENYSVNTLEDKGVNKRALQERSGLPINDDVPLVAMVSRLDGQKGLDIMGPVVHWLMNNAAGDAQFVVLGTGASEFEAMFGQLAGYHNQKMTAFLHYDAELAPLIYAGADIFLMPSLFEPCGLGQMIAMRYGTVPVVRATGGLADTVQDGITGFSFFDYSATAFWHALERAVYVYNVDRPAWRQIQRNGMSIDFSWERSALGYQQLYEWAAAQR